MTPAIVVLGYERPAALQRLLASLDRAYYVDGAAVTLVISLDASSSEAGRSTLQVAEGFQWRFGAKNVIARPEHLGVVGHFLAAGGLTREYGDVVVLEDDLTVSPAFYGYACQVLRAYGDDERVGGFCLYGLWFNGFTRDPFMPIEDGADVYFLRAPYTQGLCFSASQWSAFEAWRAANGRVGAHLDLHPAFLSFGPDEWFPSLASYLAQTGRFFCFPRVSLTTGWGDAGAHFSEASSWFQTPLLLGRREHRLPRLDDAQAVYDGFFELMPDRFRALAPHLEDSDFDVDLNATKSPENLRGNFVLTTRSVRAAEATYGLTMYPPEVNVALQTPGSDIALARRVDVHWDDLATTEARRRLHAYYWRHHRPSRMRSVRFAIAGMMQQWRRRRSR